MARSIIAGLSAPFDKRVDIVAELYEEPLTGTCTCTRCLTRLTYKYMYNIVHVQDKTVIEIIVLGRAALLLVGRGLFTMVKGPSIYYMYVRKIVTV